MCSSTVYQEYLNNLAEEIKYLEKNVEKSQNTFSEVLLESAVSINLARLQCKLCLEEVLNDQNQRIPKQIDLKTDFINKDTTERQIHLLQQQLEKNIVKSSWSVKISLMRLSSLLAQHALLFLPFYELKEYYNQLLSQNKCDILKMKDQVVIPKISYAKALLDIKEISKDIEQIKQRISGFTKDQRTSDSWVLDYSNFFTDEYKNSQFSTTR